METLYRVPFLGLEYPNLKLKQPPCVHMPWAMKVYALVVVSYFLITGGIIYDVIVEPPSVGSMTDEHGHQRPVAFLAYRVNGQYYGRTCIQLPVYNERFRFHNPGRIECTKHSKTQ
ncbi:oligosaccharyltransferase complex subunit OSTC-like [Canis lupus baileyi]|uniref:oligosaccharyltransferase complex subunit OSTC-like n=1 Tax=Canis lupus dingo TaxID=286419 RepID=UPI0015F18C8C|nr:oligosaccharyltransferase complex subunit OSTC-like [Canis lupus dingo]XP_038300321.1 oligosaccharyltransferase complex subunit OSTC-like [Canis lupus familiaris]XP_038412946.1 oligosaccharyltransferase complex subunit OSTC-like [Canis lupus familiaris]XP_038542574.1 oligosaccharyltransferase complex subunit OSTC-like [Canis lupus familiaris]